MTNFENVLQRVAVVFHYYPCFHCHFYIVKKYLLFYIFLEAVVLMLWYLLELQVVVNSMTDV